MEFTADEMAAAKKLVNELKGEDYFTKEVATKYANLFAYEGFDPLVTLAVLSKVAQTKNRVLKEDLAMMVSLFCERGSNIGRLADPTRAKMSTEGCKLVSTLMSTYNIVNGGKLSRHAITLPRVAASVPLLTCFYARHHRVNRPIITDCPRCMEVSAFGSLIPKFLPAKMDQVVYQFIYDSHCHAMRGLTRILSRGKKSDDDVIRETNLYVGAAMAGPIYSDVERVKKLVELGIINKKMLLIGKLAKRFQSVQPDGYSLSLIGSKDPEADDSEGSTFGSPASDKTVKAAE